jgi:ADP-dependent NAD(P)H-hydrate dehydratase / NAD(P)H-hydrate epimerase
MLCVVGTVPDPLFGLVSGKALIKDGELNVSGKQIPIHRGTPALIAAALQTLQVFGKSDLTVYLAGDIGLGQGSRNIYKTIVEEGISGEIHTITFHYLQPDVDWHNKVLFTMEEMEKKPVMIADAGFMYAAKMSGQAEAYDLFTPDAGELSFLADEQAPHPFYTRGFILHDDNNVVDLLKRAYSHNNASRYVLVKGSTDYITDGKKLFLTVDNPCTEAMEAIGGTGDTLTGIVSALVSTGIPIPEAAYTAAKINRSAGFNARPTPATQISEIIFHIREATEKMLRL